MKVDGFLEVQARVDVPTYPQCRDMSQMFFGMIEGIGKINGVYIETATALVVLPVPGGPAKMMA